MAQSRVSVMEERIKKFDALCLNVDEQEQLTKLNEAEVLTLKERKKKAAGFVWSSFTAVGLGSPIGAVNTVRNAQQFNKQQEELSRIKDERDKLRQQAQGRYEKAAALNDNVKYQQKGDMDYER